MSPGSPITRRLHFSLLSNRNPSLPRGIYPVMPSPARHPIPHQGPRSSPSPQGRAALPLSQQTDSPSPANFLSSSSSLLHSSFTPLLPLFYPSPPSPSSPSSPSSLLLLLHLFQSHSLSPPSHHLPSSFLTRSLPLSL